MKGILFLISTSFSVYNFSFAQKIIGRSPITVTFLLYSPDLPDYSNVYITGSISDLGNWDPSRIIMQPLGNHRWSKKIMLDEPGIVEYKFTRGSWNTEAAGDTGGPLPNFILEVAGDTVVEHNILYWLNRDPSRKIRSQVTGTVKYHHSLAGSGILPRDIVVWLPPGYEKKKNKQRYPVLYMHDGQNIFDPATSAFGTDWRVDETCDSLIRNKIIDPLIVVGIYNTPDRSLEYTPGDKGDAYMHFVVTKLKPLIDSRYRTLIDRDHTLVAGSSAGGLISFMLAWEYPEVFSFAICMSPAFKIMGIDYVSAVESSEFMRKDMFFYLYNGGVGLESELQPGIDLMISALRKKGYRDGLDYYYNRVPDGKHSEADWANYFPYAIRRCLAGK
ncbi:MAG TPA: alpha/beta hydrolase-fold protein [Cyclobacteriaceae bacterium]|nr:alpha/beta hydrolase-fold protein [Cyclobacteriaceae bacterium]